MYNSQIVMATYNGQQFIDQQIASIIDQADRHQIIIHDDGSHDETMSILLNWSIKDTRVKILQTPPKGSAVANFSYLLQESESQYIFCADQDDVWHADKLSIMTKWMKFYEGVYGNDVPLLLHSDLELIDEGGRKYASSYWEYQNLDPENSRYFERNLAQNSVTGCSMLMNRALLDLALPIPEQAIMHDAWLALVASAFGHVIPIYKPLVSYRQHNSNTVGAKRFDYKHIYRRIIDYKKFFEQKEDLFYQALAFSLKFPNTTQSHIAQEFVKIRDADYIEKIRIIRKYNFYKIGLLRNLVWVYGP